MTPLVDWAAATILLHIPCNQLVLANVMMTNDDK